jgi:excisionase family DNA binding protein
MLHHSPVPPSETKDGLTERKSPGADFSSGGQPDRLLKVDELRLALGMSRAKIYRMMQDGTLPTVRIGGSVRVPGRALYKWIEDNTKPGRQAG